MHAELIDGITIRPLRNGETNLIRAVFDRLSARSRRLRFGGAKTELLPPELDRLAQVDGCHHVLVAFVDREPVGIARLARQGDAAEVAVEVADEWQGRRVGSVLMSRLTADANAAGIKRLYASVAPENAASRALMERASVRILIG